MKKVKSIWLAAVALLTMSTSAFTMAASSAEAASVLRLARELQEIYYSWNHESGSIVFPYIEYKYEDTIYQTSFFSDQDWFNTSVEIPSDLSEFDIYLPTTMFGKYIKFTFKSVICRFPVPNFVVVDNKTLGEIFRPSPQSFISKTVVYTIDMKYIFNSREPICAQCILTPENQTGNNIIVSIGDLPLIQP